MKTTVALFSTLFALSALGAGNLSIAPGKTYTVSADNQRMMLNSLSIGDGARIQFAAGVGQWQLRAQQATIGDNVLIDGRGRDGAGGADGVAVEGKAKDCEDGRAGGGGEPGVAGTNGVSLRLQLGLVSLGGLTVRASGGDGGQGGEGGDGEDAGEFTAVCAGAPEGGDAGDGGNGGNGGNAGDISIEYWPASEAVAAMDVSGLIRTEADGGGAGAGGKAGEPGEGSDGRYIKKRTLYGDRAWLGGGDAGAKGRGGAQGREGLSGRVLVEQALVTVPTAVAPAVPAPATPDKAQPPADRAAPSDRKQEIRDIKQSLRVLMERLDQLENEE